MHFSFRNFPPDHRVEASQAFAVYEEMHRDEKIGMGREFYCVSVSDGGVHIRVGAAGCCFFFDWDF